MKCTVSKQKPENPESSSVPTNRRLPDGQYADHWVLCEEERHKGFVRPLRTSYIHVGPPGGKGCGGRTTMPMACAETYAREPSYYGSTFCCTCNGYFPVGENGEFVWPDSNERVGV